jgi:hypothetical protein
MNPIDYLAGELALTASLLAQAKSAAVRGLEFLSGAVADVDHFNLSLFVQYPEYHSVKRAVPSHTGGVWSLCFPG